MTNVVRRVALSTLVISSGLLGAHAHFDGARTLDTGSYAVSDTTAAAKTDANDTVMTDANDPVRARVTARIAKLPLRFEANAGQWDSRVRFRARKGGATLFITDDGMTVGLQNVTATHRGPGETPNEEGVERDKALKDAKGAAVSIQLVGAKPRAPIGERELVAKSNFFIGNDPTKWRTVVPNYAEVRAKDWLPGVDVVWHGGDSGLEYDLEVAAGVDARKIALEVQGAESLHVNGEGALEIETAAGKLVQKPPRVVQDGRELVVRYRICGRRHVALDMETYDPSSAVLVDPVLTYATYFGGSGEEQGQGIAVDGNGNAYVTGFTTGGIPTLIGSYETTFGGGNYDAFVTKLNAAGTALVYATYLGGSGSDSSAGVAVDGSGNAYVVGYTQGSFPTTTGAYQTTFGGGTNDMFVTKLNAAGTALGYSTYLGGSADSFGAGIAIDGGGNAYVTGTTSGSFPTTPGAAQTTYGGGDYDVVVTKLNGAGTALVYSTYLGGSDHDVGQGIAIDGSGSAYVAGYTQGTFPTTPGVYQPTYGGGHDDVFVARLNATGTAFVYSSYLGGSGEDLGLGVAVDANGNAYVTGQTAGSFPTTTGADQTTFGGGVDAFVTKLNASGTALVYSTYVGGILGDWGRAISVGASDNVYVTGQTAGSFPTTTGAAQTTYGGGNDDVFVMKLNATGTARIYATYVGGSGDDDGRGIAVDGSGNAYVTGYTGGGFPTTTGSFQTMFGGGGNDDAFVAEVLDPELVNGTACTQAELCATGLCIDGVCCDATCAGECQACNVAEHVGICTPVTGAPHGTRTACAGTGACGSSCDGTNTQICTFPGPSTLCGSTCSAASETDSICDGAGSCTVQAPRSCNNFVCADANVCKTSCSSAADCELGFICASDGNCEAAQCVDEHTSSAGEDCTPFKCNTSGSCKTQCASVDDCVSPSVCDPNGTCVTRSSPSAESGCSWGASSNGSSPWGTLLVAATAFILAKSRRRVRSTS